MIETLNNVPKKTNQDKHLEIIEALEKLDKISFELAYFITDIAEGRFPREEKLEQKEKKQPSLLEVLNDLPEQLSNIESRISGFLNQAQGMLFG